MALIVEDEAPVRHIIKRGLARLGSRVLEADDGESALGVAAAYNGPIDIVLTDLIMPRMSGGEFVRHLVQSRPDIHIVLISGYLDNHVIRESLGNVPCTFLPKPFTREQLDAAISRAAGVRRDATKSLIDGEPGVLPVEYQNDAIDDNVDAG